MLLRHDGRDVGLEGADAVVKPLGASHRIRRRARRFVLGGGFGRLLRLGWEGVHVEHHGWFAAADAGAESARTDDERLTNAGVARPMNRRENNVKLIRRAKAVVCTYYLA